MRISYHNHTVWSDGTATLAEMLAGARAAGVDEFGLSDHFVLFPEGHGTDAGWIMPPEFLDAYVATLWEAGEHAPEGVTLRVGVEADYFPQTVEAAKARLARHRFDYIIGSVHFTARDPDAADSPLFPIDCAAGCWDALTPDGRNAVWRQYWARIRELAACGLCDFIGHLDLPKKFGHFPTIDLSAEICEALDAIADHGLAIEINTAGWQKPVREAYPSLALLREARRRDIPLLINADAHAPGDVAADYDRAYALARAAGYTELVRYVGRERIGYRMDE